MQQDLIPRRRGAGEIDLDAVTGHLYRGGRRGTCGQRSAVAILVHREHLVTGGAAELHFVIKSGHFRALAGHEAHLGGATAGVLAVGQTIARAKREEIPPQLVIQIHPQPVLLVHGIGHGGGQLTQLALGRFQIVAGGEEAANTATNILVVQDVLVGPHIQLQLGFTGIGITRHHAELGNAAIEHQGVAGTHVDQHAAVVLRHGADLHLLGELANGLVALVKQHQVLFRRALGANDGLIQIVDAVDQAVHPLGLITDGGVDGVGLLVQLR